MLLAHARKRVALSASCLLRAKTAMLPSKSDPMSEESLSDTELQLAGLGAPSSRVDETLMEELGAFGTVRDMREPLILRGLLQLMGISTFFVVRYVLDVLLTPPVLDSLMRDAYNAARGAIAAVWPLLRTCYGPLAPFVVFHLWKWCNVDVIQHAVLLVCSLRLATSIIMNNAVTIGRLTKGDVWPALMPLVRFARVSGGRLTEPDAAPSQRPWFRGCRRLMCLAVPWIIRAAVLDALLRVVGSPFAAIVSGMLSPWSWVDGGLSGKSPVGSSGDCVCPESREACASFVGQPMACHELRLAREFNARAMPTLQRASYREVRRAMTEYGLYGSAWHVGHACPDPNKDSTTDDEDRGWNLFAQHAADNVRLGHCLVSCAEAEYTGALHIKCTRAARCVATCADPAVTSPVS